jgi:hypothetical protein
MKVKNLYQVSLFIAIVFIQLSCNNFTFRPHSKKQQSKEQPSVLFCDRIVDFRLAEGGWPNSMSDFMNKGIKYYEVANNFPYQTTEFKRKDSTEMTFYFSNHIKDIKNYNKTQKIDLNSYNGNIRFWKEGGKFVWRINMK